MFRFFKKLFKKQIKTAGHSSVAIPDPLKPIVIAEPPLYFRKPIGVLAVRWAHGMWPHLLRGNLFPEATNLLLPLLHLTVSGDINAEPFKSIPNGAWVIFCPKIARLWWISAADFANGYHKGEIIAQPTYIPVGSHWKDVTHFDVIHAQRKAWHVHALPLHGERTVMETLKDLELRLNRGSSLTVWEPKICAGHTSPNQGDWVVVDIHNYAWVVEADAFDILYGIQQ